MQKNDEITFKDYVDIKDYETAISIASAEDFAYIFYKSYDVLRIDESYEVISQVV